MSLALAGGFFTIVSIVVHLLSHVRPFAAPWTGEGLASLSFTISRSFLKLLSIESVIPSNHLILCRSLLLLPSIFPFYVFPLIKTPGTEGF